MSWKLPPEKSLPAETGETQFPSSIRESQAASRLKVRFGATRRYRGAQSGRVQTASAFAALCRELHEERSRHAVMF